MMVDDEKEQIELYIQCRKLKDLDVMSRSDPQVKVYLKNKNNQLSLIGQTEVVPNNLNPNFTQTIIMDFIFETQQTLHFEVLDIDKGSTDLIGRVETTVSKIVGCKNSTLITDLTEKNKKTGNIIIRAEKTQNCSEYLQMKFKAHFKGHRMIGFGDTKGKLIFNRIMNNQKVKLMETEWYRTTDPIYEMFEITTHKLCQGDPNREIEVELWDHHHAKDDEYMGKGKFTLTQLMGDQKQIDLYNNSQKNIGNATLMMINKITRPKFIDYLRGNTQLNLTVAIDFTGSNGHYANQGSLHYMNGQQMNQYQQAIRQVGDIVINYDFDQMVPVYGFGAKILSMNSEVLHCFPMNFNPSQPAVYGVDGILQAYQNGMSNLKFGGPTLFNVLLTQASQLAESTKSTNVYQYHVILILTDGCIHDFDQTKDIICRAADLPMSIIIIGVGNADFSSMVQLDGDQGLYNTKGQKCQRDLVQFVQFNSFHDVQSLQAAVLKELPNQVVQYYQRMGVKPMQAQQFTESCMNDIIK